MNQHDLFGTPPELKPEDPRSVDLKWWEDRVQLAMRDGAVLRHHSKINKYATEGLPPEDRRNGQTLSARFVKKLADSGQLERIGVDLYALSAKGRAA